MKPVLNNDKFEKLEEKNRETKNAIKNTAIIGSIATLALILLSKKFKAPNIKLPKLGPKIKAGLNKAKTKGLDLFDNLKQGTIKGWNKLKGLFKKTTS